MRRASASSLLERLRVETVATQVSIVERDGQVVVRGAMTHVTEWISRYVVTPLGQADVNLHLKAALELVAIHRRWRPRLARAIGLYGKWVGVCAVSAALLYAIYRATPYRDGGVADLQDHSICPIRTALVPRVGGAPGDTTEVHPLCAHPETQLDSNLIVHLRTYTIGRVRNGSLWTSLLNRAKAWQRKAGLSDHCFSRILMGSMVAAFTADKRELDLLRMAFSDNLRATYQAFGREGVVFGTVPSVGQLLLGRVRLGDYVQNLRYGSRGVGG